MVDWTGHVMGEYCVAVADDNSAIEFQVNDDVLGSWSNDYDDDDFCLRIRLQVEMWFEGGEMPRDPVALEMAQIILARTLRQISVEQK